MSLGSFFKAAGTTGETVATNSIKQGIPNVIGSGLKTTKTTLSKSKSLSNLSSTVLTGTVKQSDEVATGAAKNVVKSADEVVIGAGKGVVKQADEVGSGLAKSVAKNADEAAADLAKGASKNAGETLESAAKSQKNFLGKAGDVIKNNPKLAATFGIGAAGAIAFCAYSLDQYLKKNNFQMQIIEIKKNTSYLLEDPTKLVIKVKPVNGEMIKLSTTASIKFISNSTATPSLNGFIFPITNVNSSGVEFTVDISTLPNFKTLILNSPASGVVLYQTSFDGEAKNTIDEASKGAGKLAADIVNKAADGLSSLLGIDPSTLKVIFAIIIFLIIYTYFIGPIISIGKLIMSAFR